MPTCALFASGWTPLLFPALAATEEADATPALALDSVFSPAPVAAGEAGAIAASALAAKVPLVEALVSEASGFVKAAALVVLRLAAASAAFRRNAAEEPAAASTHWSGG